MLLSGGVEAAGSGEIVEAEQAGLAAQSVDELGESGVAERGGQFHVEAAVGVKVTDDVTATGGRR